MQIMAHMKMQLYQPKLSLLKISGADAADFLHRLTTQDFKSIAVGEEKQAAFLQPNSMIKHLFSVFKNSPTSFDLWILPESLDEIKNDLEKFHFAEDLKFETSGKTKVVHGELTELERVDKGLFKWGQDVLVKNLMLEIPYEDYLAEQKGCYPGQEVVERVFTYGKVAKKLVLLDLDKHIGKIIGDDVVVDSKKIGTITSRGNKKAFAYLQKPFYENL